MNTSIDTMAQDNDHLRLLAIFHWVVAGITALFSLFPVIHLVMGLFIVTGHFDGKDAPPAIFGWMFVVIALVFILSGLAFSACLAYAATCLRDRKRHLFCLVMAGLSCAFMPFGTVLGVFTLVTLLKPSVKAQFIPPVADA